MRKISVVGLGYAGLPVAVALGLHNKVIGYDLNNSRIKELTKKYDRNNNIYSQELKSADIKFTSNPDDLKDADFHIVVVPTPINTSKTPDLSYLIKASKIVGSQLKQGDIVVYESTVYPGVTEEICIPLLETESQLCNGHDFSVGYSPERINPCDKEHHLGNIMKIIAAQDKRTLDIMAKIYSKVVKAGVYKLSCIKAAEATKIIENTQRDLNISIMNEFALILHKAGLNTSEIFKAAQTKWNFLPFKPGLVGGHCIGTNSYYLAYKAKTLGYYPDMILAGRRVNDTITKHIVDQAIKNLIKLKTKTIKSKVVVLGLSYKENCPDFRGTRVMPLIKELREYDFDVLVHDPIVHQNEVYKKLGIKLTNWDDIPKVTMIIIAVAHDQFKKIPKKKFLQKLTNPGLIIDIKNILNPDKFKTSGIKVWQL